jgi:putative FmdB family regulatory protein
MPTYEFGCPDGHTFDRFYRKISLAPSELPCPICGKTAVRKVSAGAGLVFKGSGFYITDYGKDGKKGQGTGKAGEAKAGESGSPGTSSESAASSETKSSSSSTSSTASSKSSSDE